MNSRSQLPPIKTQRAPPPSTISKTSSESSNATIRPAVKTPRAESPASRFPFSDRPGIPSRRISIIGAGPDNTVWEENTVLDGLAWRLEQYLNIGEPPYGLIIPEMVAAARQDMKICGPALDMLVSATLADPNAPIWELPVVETDSSGLKHASQTLPFSDLNCPDVLKGLFKRWANAAMRVQKLENHLPQEIARNICDMELVTNVVVPQVNDLAKEFKGIAVDVIRRKTFLSRVTERLKEELRRNDRATLLLPRTRPQLPSVGEVNETPSQSSSRSSSRASHRSRSRSHSRGGSTSQSAPYAGSGEGGVYQALRPRGSSTSLRLDQGGLPLPDDEAEYGGERIAPGSEMSSSTRTAIINSGPRPSSRGQQNDILYGGLLPLNIPAFPPGVQEAPTAPAAPSPNLPADITTSAPAHIQGRSSTSTSDPSFAPFLTVGPLDSNQNMFSSSHSQTYTTPSSVPPSTQVPSQLPSHPGPPPPLGIIHLQPMNPNGTVAAPSSSSRFGPRPRPLPPRPTRSPLPQLPGEQHPPSNAVVNPHHQIAPPPPPAPTNFGSNFVVPGQAGPSTAPYDVHSIQVSSETPFVVPSESPLEVSSSFTYDLKAARHRFAMSSSSSLSHSDHEQNDPISQPNNNNKRHGTVQPNMVGIYGGLAELNEGGSKSRIPSWGSDGSQRGLPHIPKNEKPHKEHGLLKGVKALISRNNQSNIDTQPHQYTYQPAENDAVPHHYGRFGSNQHAPSPFTPPDTALSYYYNYSPASSDVQIAGVGSSSSGPVRMHPPTTNGVTPPPPPVPRSNEVMTQSRVPNYMLGSSQVSPGYAEAFQANPVAARMYNGAGPSRPGHRRTPSPPPAVLKEASQSISKPIISPQPVVDDQENLDLVAIRETMYGAMIDALASLALKPVMEKDAKRAYYSAVCLAILNVGMTVQPESNDTPNLITMMSREIRLSDLPGAYKTCFTQLAAIGREARKLREDDDERAIAYVARGKPLPEPRIGRVQKLLERGVGYVGPDGRIRGTSNSSGGTGRSREFTSKINALAFEIMKLAAFREDMLPILVA